MDKKIIKGLIDEKLEVIQEQFSIIREYDGKIPIIELDLLMTSIRDLYELILSLQLENVGMVLPKAAPQPETPKATPPPAPVPEPAAPVRLSPSILSMEPLQEEEPVKISPPVEKVEPVTPEPPVTPYQPPVPEPPVPEPPAPEPPAPEPPAPEPPAPEPMEPPVPIHEPEPDLDQPHEKYQRITFDLFSEGGGNTLADRYREGQEKRIADKLGENKVLDLRTTIGINDKFLFINELFEGDMRIYEEAIQKLNATTTMAQADMQLLDLKIVYNWDSESPTVKKFVELVRRKF
jgi:hypothetical protein